MFSIMFDTETTGLIVPYISNPYRQPHIVELYAVVFDDKDYSVIDEIDTLINPSMNMPTDAYNIHHISDDMVKDSPKWEKVWERFQAMCSQCDSVIGHNVMFDIQMVDYEMRRLEKEFVWPVNKVCTVEATEFFNGYRLSLDALSYKAIPGYSASYSQTRHRAAYDTKMLLECYKALVKHGEIL